MDANASILIKHDSEKLKEFENLIEEKFTDLALAVYHKDSEKVKQLLQQGSDPNYQLTYGIFRGCTPLHIAALYGDKEVIEILVENGSKINEMNIFGETALDFAREQGQDGAVEFLVSQGGYTGDQTKARKKSCVLM